MMKIIAFVLAIAAVRAFNVEPAGRRGFLVKTVEAMAGAAFVVAAPKPALADEKLVCETEMGPFEVPSIAACHGESKDMTPSEEAYADFLMSKMDISPNNVLDDKTNKNKKTSGNKAMLKNHLDK